MKKILVTGASGFIGRKILKLLVNGGYEVHAVSRNIFNCNKVKWHSANLLDKYEADALIKKIEPECIFHFAWYVIPGKYNNFERNILWLQASIEILKSFKEAGGKKFIFAGTCAEYGKSYGLMNEENTPSNPESIYGICKLSFEKIALEYCHQVAMKFVSGRIFYLYGENENENRVIPYVINKLLKNEIALCSNGNQIRDFMYVDDVVGAFYGVLENNVEGIVNIGSGQAIRLRDILMSIGEKLGKTELIHLGGIKANVNEPPVIVADNQKLIIEANWKQQYNLDQGIDRVINWWKCKNYNSIS